jgi:iron(III) transport system substrate-binding protein
MHQARPSFFNQCVRLTLLFVIACSLTAEAQDKGPNETIYMYQQADRQARLIEKARQEGMLTLYTSLPMSRAAPLTKAFEKKYGIKTEIWRANNDKIVQRAVTEARGKRYTVDVVESDGPALERLAREKLLTEFYSPYIADIPVFGRPSHGLWVSSRMNMFVMAYNTDKVRKEDLPKNFEGFLDPKWKGRLGIESSDAEWMATFVKIRGQEAGMNFFRKLAEMKPDVRTGHILLTELVAAGEIDVGLTVYNSTADTLKKRGARLEWVALDPVIARPQGLGLAMNAPHPNAALLFADFVLSPEGQRLLDSLGVIPTSTKTQTELNNFKYTMMDSGSHIDEAEKWEKIWNDLLIHK